MLESASGHRVGSEGERPAESPRTYFAFGFSIRSERPIPELTEIASRGGAEADIRWRTLSAELPGAHYRDNVTQVASDAIQVTAHGVVRLRMRAEIEIAVDPFPGAVERDVRAYLLGTALGLLCHQRDLLPLHANVIVVRDQAIAFAGESGMGKSTLAAFFQKRGHNLLSDDVCAVSFPSGGQPLAWSGIPRLRLWKDAADNFGIAPHRLDRLVTAHEKYSWALDAHISRQGVPLRQIYVLSDPAACASGEIARLAGSEAAAAVMEQTFRREFLGLIGGTGRRFARTIEVLAKVPVFRVPWQHDFARLAEEGAKLEAHMRDETNADAAA